MELSFEQETQRGIQDREPGVEFRLDDHRPGRETFDALTAAAPPSELATSHLPPRTLMPRLSSSLPPNSVGADDPPKVPTVAAREPTYRYLARPDMDAATDMTLLAAKEELELIERQRTKLASAIASWEPFGPDRVPRNPKPVRQPAMEDIPAWARPTPSELREDVARMETSEPPTRTDPIKSLPALPWAVAETELSVPSRPDSMLNSMKPRTHEDWAIHETEKEYYQLESNLDHLSQLHPSLVNEHSIANLLDRYLPLPYFHGDRRRATLDRMFALGLSPSRKVLSTLIRAHGQFRSGAEYRKTELEDMVAQFEAAGMPADSTEQRVETLAVMERALLTAGDQIGAEKVKADLYALTPSPPRPTDLLMRIVLGIDVANPKTGTQSFSQVLAFAREIAGSGQPVPDEVVRLLARTMPLDRTTLDGYLDAAAWAKEELRQPLGPSFWDSIFHRAVGHLRASTAVKDESPEGATPLSVTLALFGRLETPSPASVRAGFILLEKLPIITVGVQERLDAIRDVFRVVLRQLDPTPVNPSDASDPSATSLAQSTSMPASTASELRALFDTVQTNLLRAEMPFTLDVASFVAELQEEQTRLLPGYSRWHDQVLTPLLDPLYPLQPAQISAAYAILVATFPDKMAPVEIYWRFLRKVAFHLRVEPMATTQAALSVLQTRLQSGEDAFAAKTLMELLETLKEEVWKAGWDRRGDKAKKETSLDRDPRRAVLDIESVALRMDSGLLPGAFWNTLVEATSFAPLAQDAAWKVLAAAYPSEIRVDAAILVSHLIVDSLTPAWDFC